MKMVLGYLPVDELPAKARDLRLFCRVTFILESYRAQAVDAFFDAELYAALVDVVRRIVGGPPPYNDSYAVPVFSSEDISDDVMREVELVCARLDAVIEEVIAGKRTVARGRARDRLLGTLRKLVGW